MYKSEIKAIGNYFSELVGEHKYYQVIEEAKPYIEIDNFFKYIVGKSLISVGKFEEGRELLKVAYSPKHPVPADYYLHSYLEQYPNDYFNRQEVFDAADKLIEEHYACGYYLKAQLMLHKDQAEEAIEMVKNGLKENLIGDGGDCEFFLGYVYRFGVGVKKNSRTALKYFVSAIKKDHTNSMYYAAKICQENAEKGKNCTEFAIEYARKGSNANDSRCMTILGDLFLKDKYGIKNESIAYYWHKRAARYNEPISLLELGVKSFKEQDYDNAKVFFTQSLIYASQSNNDDNDCVFDIINDIQEKNQNLSWFWKQIKIDYDDYFNTKEEIQA